MALNAEIIEGAAHVDFLARRHVEKRQVNRASPAVAGFRGDIALVEQHVLVQLRIKIRLHARIVQLLRPTDEMADRHLRAIGVVNLQPIALRLQIVRYRLQRFGRFPRHQHARLRIPVDTVTDEIIGRIIADL